MLIFGIQDAQKVLEEDSLLEAYADMHLGGVILFEKNIAKKRSKNQLKALVDEIQSISKIPSFIAIDEEGGNVSRLKPKYGFHETKTAKHLGNRNNLDSTYYFAKLTSDLLKELGRLRDK
jgi:beta-N-acetylhexosaminidase